jgi:hypothetical protein
LPAGFAILTQSKLEAAIQPHDCLMPGSNNPDLLHCKFDKMPLNGRLLTQ